MYKGIILLGQILLVHGPSWRRSLKHRNVETAPHVSASILKYLRLFEVMNHGQDNNDDYQIQSCVGCGRRIVKRSQSTAAAQGTPQDVFANCSAASTITLHFSTPMIQLISACTNISYLSFVSQACVAVTRIKRCPR